MYLYIYIYMYIYIFIYIYIYTVYIINTSNIKGRQVPSIVAGLEGGGLGASLSYYQVNDLKKGVQRHAEGPQKWGWGFSR